MLRHAPDEIPTPSNIPSPTSSPLLNLPDRVLTNVLRLVGPRELARLARVCRRMNAAVTQDDALWQPLVEQLLARSAEQIAKPPRRTWREHWLRMALPPRVVAVYNKSPTCLHSPIDDMVALDGFLFVFCRRQIIKFQSPGISRWNALARKTFDSKMASMGLAGRYLCALDDTGCVRLVDSSLQVVAVFSRPPPVIIPLDGGRFLGATFHSPTLDWLVEPKGTEPTGMELPGALCSPPVVVDGHANFLLGPGVCGRQVATPPGSEVEYFKLDRDLRVVAYVRVPIPPAGADWSGELESESVLHAVGSDFLMTYTTVKWVAERYMLLRFDVVRLDGRRTSLRLDSSRMQPIEVSASPRGSLLYAVLEDIDSGLLHLFGFNNAAQLLWTTVFQSATPIFDLHLDAFPDGGLLLCYVGETLTPTHVQVLTR